MAEIATIARPYAEALFKAAGADGAKLKDQVAALAARCSTWWLASRCKRA